MNEAANESANEVPRVNSAVENHTVSNSRVPEFWSCVKVEVAVLGLPVLMSFMVSVDVKQH